MAVATSSEKLKSELAVTQYDHDPDGTGAVDVAWVDMRDYESIMIGFFRTVGTSNLTLKLIANSQSNGGGTDVEIKAYSGSEPNAVGDYVWLEATAEEIGTAGADLRYVSANVTLATGTDEAVVTYIRKGRKRFTGMTSDNIA